MVNKIKTVMLELGYGFTFISNQYRIAVEGNEYFIDLLFYSRRLQSFVAMELKKGKFQPEYAGEMNFYLNLLDDYMSLMKIRLLELFFVLSVIILRLNTHCVE